MTNKTNNEIELQTKNNENTGLLRLRLTMTKKIAFAFIIAMLLMLTAFIAFGGLNTQNRIQTAHAQVINNVQHIDANGNTQTANNVTVWNGATLSTLFTNQALNSGWHMFVGNYSGSWGVVINGTVRLIIADNANFNVRNIQLFQGHTLYIYSQSLGANMGRLTADGSGGGIGGTNVTIPIVGVPSSVHAGNLTINGGYITANGGGASAGIGGANSGNGGVVIINNGIINANGGGGTGAGIGGGLYGNGGTVTINGGTVLAASSTSGNAAGIGGGAYGTAGELTINGNTLVRSRGSALNINPRPVPTLIRGILFENLNGTVAGDVTLPSSFTIDSVLTATHQLTVPSGATLRIPSGISLATIAGSTIINNGTIIPENGSTITINGNRTGNLIQGANVSASATIGNVTANSITINAPNAQRQVLATTGQTVAGMEFGLGITNNVNSVISWQTGLTFNNLLAGQTYFVFARSGATAHFAAGTSTASLASATTQAAPVHYIDINGNRQEIPIGGYTIWTDVGLTRTFSDGGWYVFRGTITGTSALTVNGTANIILEDNANWIINGRIRVDGGNSLNIFAQSTGGNKGRLQVNGLGLSAAIGGSIAGGNVTIAGGFIDARGGANSAGIGGNDELMGTGRNVRIYGGYVVASGGRYGIGAGGTNNVAGSLYIRGNAVVRASSIQPTGGRHQGVVIVGNTGAVHGNVNLQNNLTINSGQTLTVGNGASLIVPSGITLANNGTITPQAGSTVAINGTRTGNLIGGSPVGGTGAAPTATSPFAITLADGRTVAATTGQTLQFGRSYTNSAAAASNWQFGRTFTGLTPNTQYFFFVRSLASANFADGTAVLLGSATTHHTFTVSPTSVSITATNLTANLTLGGTATGAITHSVSPALPSGVTANINTDGLLTINDNRGGGAAAVNGNFVFTLTRSGVQASQTLTVNIVLPARAHTFTVSPTSVSITATNLTANLTLGGSATGEVTHSVSPSLPSGITANISTAGLLTITDTRTAGAAAVNDNFVFTLTRQGITAAQTVAVSINLPAVPHTFNATPNPIIITADNATLISTMTWAGTASGTVTLASNTLPSGIGVSLNDTTLTFIDTRAAGSAAITNQNATITLSRGEVLHIVNVYITRAAVAPLFNQQIRSDETRRSEANCLEAATYFYSCISGAISSTLYFIYGEPLGHNWGNAVVTPPTCTTGGFTTETCSHCGDTHQINPTPATGHTFNQQVRNATTLRQAACYDYARSYFYSCHCGHIGTSWFYYGNPLQQHQHIFNQQVRSDSTRRSAATCLEAATYWYSCSCGNISDTIWFYYGSPLQHDFNQRITNESTLRSGATCLDAATYWYSCSCGNISTTIWFYYGEPLGHNWGNPVITLPTCTTGGFTTETCSRCGETRQINPTPATGHNFNLQVRNATTLRQAACYDYARSYFYSCYCGHLGTNWFYYGNPLEQHQHNFNQQIRNDSTRRAAATCLAAATYWYSCSCGYISTTLYFTFGMPLGHNWGNPVVVPPTCTTDGFTTETCSHCSETRQINHTDATGHNFNQRIRNDATRRSEATCLAAATYWYSCECGEISTTLYFSYGALLQHSFTVRVVNDQTRRSAATHTAAATYWYSCACGEVSDTLFFSYGTPLIPHSCTDLYCDTCNPKCGQYPRECGRTDCNESHSREYCCMMSGECPCECDTSGYYCNYCYDAGCVKCEPTNGYDCEYCNDEGCPECVENNYCVTCGKYPCECITPIHPNHTAAQSAINNLITAIAGTDAAEIESALNTMNTALEADGVVVADLTFGTHANLAALRAAANERIEYLNYEPSTGLSGGAIAGIVIGSILGLLVILFLVYWFVLRKKGIRLPFDKDNTKVAK